MGDEKKPHQHTGTCKCKPPSIPFDVERAKQRPNDRCACGSGKKFKKCFARK